MIRRILLGVSDSPAALAAARFTVDLAASCGATLRAIHVLADGDLTAALVAASDEARAGGSARLAARRMHGGDAVLRHVAELGRRAGVAVETARVGGEPAECVLAEAERWRPDVVVLGRGDQPGDRQPHVGPQARRVLEFARQPVLLVPSAR